MARDRTALARQRRRLANLREQGIGRATVAVHDDNRDILDALRPLLRDPAQGEALRRALAGLTAPPEPPRLDEVLAVLRDRREELQRRGVLHASVFGSVARGEARPDSDVDILVTLDPEARVGLLKVIGIENDLSARTGRKVDLVRRNKLATFARAGALKDEIPIF